MHQSMFAIKQKWVCMPKFRVSLITNKEGRQDMVHPPFSLTYCFWTSGSRNPYTNSATISSDCISVRLQKQTSRGSTKMPRCAHTHKQEKLLWTDKSISKTQIKHKGNMGAKSFNELPPFEKAQSFHLHRQYLCPYGPIQHVRHDHRLETRIWWHDPDLLPPKNSTRYIYTNPQMNEWISLTSWTAHYKQFW